jgi:hypothetical protein
VLDNFPFSSAQTAPGLDTTADIVCPLCVQYRCSVCHSGEWPVCLCWDSTRDYMTEAEPYWPSGEVAVITQTAYCDPCRLAMGGHARP